MAAGRPAPSQLSFAEALAVVRDMPSKDSLLSLLRALPEQSERSFETAIAQVVEGSSALVPFLLQVLEDRSLGLEMRYGALFTLGTYYRRYKDISKLQKLLDNYESEFERYGTFHHLYSMCLKLRGQPDELHTSVDRARTACKLLPQHIGILHNLAEAIVQCCEEEVSLADRTAALKEAQDILTTILASEPAYAKFYCTKGRLDALHHRFAEAKSYIRRAIDKEDSAKRDYLVRLSDYEAHLLSVQIQESAWKQLQRMTEIYDQVKQAQGRNLEILGFFSAVVALIIGGVQTSQRHGFLESAQLLLTLTGALLFGFAGLGLLVHGLQNVQRSVLLFLLAILVLAFAFKILPVL